MPPKKGWKTLGEDPCPPKRPQQNGYGTLGRKILLTTNLFPVNVARTDIKLYHYDVTIKNFRGNEALPKARKMEVFEKMKTQFPKVFENLPLAFDQMKNAYSVKLLPKNKKGHTYEVGLSVEGSANSSKFTVTLKKVQEASVNDLLQAVKRNSVGSTEIPNNIMQMVEVMFRHYRAVRFEPVNSRNFVSLSGEFAPPNNIGGGKQGLSGFFASLRPAEWKDGSLLLNLDMAHKAFYKEQLVIEFLKEIEIIGRDEDLKRPFSHDAKRRATKNLKGLRIRVTHAQRTYKFNDLVDCADNIKFDYSPDNKKETERKITVTDYIRERYNIKLNYPKTNCVHVGNPDKKIYIPLELCKIAKGQKVVKKLSDTEVSNFIRSTAVPPAERLKQIQAVAYKNDFKNDPMLKALTFSIEGMPVKTQGRVLPAPSLTMLQKKFEPYQGTWDIRDKKFNNPAQLTCWTVMNYDSRRTRDDTLNKFLDDLVRMGKEKGMTIEKPVDIHSPRGEPNPMEDLRYYKKKFPDIQLVMIVLPGRKYYGAIKVAGDTDVSIITQCVQGQNVFKCQPQTIGNILLKINAKLGGVNFIVTGDPQYNNTGLLKFAEPFLVMGADVNHPPAGGERGIPSMAAVVGSFDLHAAKYALERRAQTERVEMIQDLETITKNLLTNFYKKTKGRKPGRILFYRDGVSESQFREVLAKEMMAMRRACASLGPDYKPGITFICVQKRHHTRLFCDERDGVGRSKNVPPGTIVDHDITHPTENDFFLCSHQGIQGTSRPTHYHVLWDDNDLDVNELQMLTYRLCHVYSRCSRSVSIPTPVYYAHLAAFRGKVYISEILEGGSDRGSMMSGDSDRVDKEQEVEIKRTSNITTKDNPMACKQYYI